MCDGWTCVRKDARGGHVEGGRRRVRRERKEEEGAVRR